jgi:hypothetical protein
MIFNLTTKQLFKVKDHSLAIWPFKNDGPVFGEAGLSTFSPFNGSNKCVSNANSNTYQIGIDSQGRNKLTNLKCNEFGMSFFSISEIEVWEIIL